MFYRRIVRENFGLGAMLLLSLVFLSGCSKPAPALPKDLFGISVGESRDEAQKRLSEIATFERDEEKRQQVWQLKNDPRFYKMAIGYDRENRVRYITAFVEKATAKERVRFTDVGDLGSAKKEILEPHHRYIWDVAGEGEEEGKPDYQVNVYGDNPDFVTIYTLAEKFDPNRLREEQEDEEKGER